MDKLDLKIYNYSDLSSTAVMDIAFGEPTKSNNSQYKIRENEFTILEFIIMRHTKFDHFYGPNLIHKEDGMKIIIDLKIASNKLKTNSLKGKDIRQIIDFPEVYNYLDIQLENQKEEIIEFINNFSQILEQNYQKHNVITIWGV